MSGQKKAKRARFSLPAESQAGPSSRPSPTLASHFGTLEREHRFRFPSDVQGDFNYPAAHELIRPHIDSFDALFEGATNEQEAISSRSGENGGGNGAGIGLLQLLVDDLQPKTVFDGVGEANGGLGNKIECRSM